MKEIGPPHPLSYRKEVLERMFGCVKSADSFFVIGGASTGKTRLMDFIFRNDVQTHYLGDQAQKTWLIRVDLNRHYAKEDWHFYELFLSSMMLTCSQYSVTEEIFGKLVDLESKVMTNRDFLQALRFFELAVNMLCQNEKNNLCFLLDEFDEMYSTMPKEFFAQLRAVRDANKNQVCFGLFLRDLPDRLRNPSDNESFYELISHRMIGLGPYSFDDAIRVSKQMEERREINLEPELRDTFVVISGGHPGLLQALLSMRINLVKENEQMGDLNWLIKQEFMRDECNKICKSISKEEQDGLIEAAQGEFKLIPDRIFKLLNAKGLLKKQEGAYKIFSPIFELFLQEKNQSVG